MVDTRMEYDGGPVRFDGRTRAAYTAEDRDCKTCRFQKLKGWEDPCAECSLSADLAAWQPKEEKQKEERRPKPLPTPVYIFDREDSRFPDRIRISFDDGTTAVYTLHVNQPHPLVMENIRIIRKWRAEGYQYVPQRQRRSNK